MIEKHKMLNFFKSPKSPKTLKLLKSLRLFAATIPFIFLLGGLGGCVWFVPYNFQPSYHEFKKMCKLDPDIYQGNIYSEEYYNKVLALFDTSLDSLNWAHIQDNLKFRSKEKAYVYRFKKSELRIDILALMVFGEDKIAARDKIDHLNFFAVWDSYRPVYEYESCDLFRKK